MSPDVAAPSRKEGRRRKRQKKNSSLNDEDFDTDKNESKKLKPSRNRGKRKNGNDITDDPYGRFDAATAAALRKDDEEIAALEARMGLSNSREKNRLHKEYAKLEGYGDDFGSFLDDIDTMVQRVVAGEDEEDYESYRKQHGPLLGKCASSDDHGFQYSLLEDEEGDITDEDDDEIIPMKGAPLEADLMPSDDDDNKLGSDEEQNNRKSHGNPSDSEDGESDDDDAESKNNELDHDVNDTYRPSEGEDIYGNPINTNGSAAEPKKYVPPHLRKKHELVPNQKGSKVEDERFRQADEEKQKGIQRLLNNSLNRLSENTLVSVAQAIASNYPSYPTAIVNECIWKNLQIACIQRPHLMTGLIPVYVACLSGVHVQLGDAAQLGEYLLEMTVTDLWKELKTNAPAHRKDDIIQKDASNVMLVLCYLYNYGIVHCSFLYSVIRSFLESFREMEVELLLLMLSHCGRTLRSDDPTALKEIVLLVQKRSLENQKQSEGAAPLSSRIEYMVSAIMDLKNNKKRKADSVHAETILKLRKLLGQCKSSSASKSADPLRIGLDDILNATTKGRWWKVGASWVGNQYRFSDGDDQTNDPLQAEVAIDTEQSMDAEEDAKLLKLAAKARMNTETKRAIFCIIMKSDDCEDAFEKLSKSGHMKNRKERDVVRVLMECCGNEKAYNPFYAHLAARMCDYQPQCKFSMQLAYWDVFKQVEGSVSVRKAANLAKLLFHLVVLHPSLKLGVLKALDMSSPDELSETAMIFLTVFWSLVMEHFENPSDLKVFLEQQVKKKGRGYVTDKLDDDRDDVIGNGESVADDDHDDDGLGPSISIFLLQTLKASPKNKKGSKFRTNLKAAVKACDTEEFFL